MDLTSGSFNDVFDPQSPNSHTYYNLFLYIIANNYLIIYYLFIE